MTKEKEETGQHSYRYPFCIVTFWKDNTSATDKEDWTRCVVSPLGMYTHGEQTFENTSNDIYKRDGLIQFLEKVFILGQKTAKQEIRQVLEIK